MSLLSALTPGITTPQFKTGAGPGQYAPGLDSTENVPQLRMPGVGMNAEMARAAQAFPGLSPQAALAQWRSAGAGNPQLNPAPAQSSGPSLSDLILQPVRAVGRLNEALTPRR